MIGKFTCGSGATDNVRQANRPARSMAMAMAMAMAIAMDLAGLLAWRTLSVAPLPQVNFPIIEVRPPSKVAPAPW